ncbi:hypothetical protein PINS_up005887 [Pythium insidiosum]|nr:hypothetical protein PINS_up005887 [Pythium insidiosum]
MDEIALLQAQLAAVQQQESALKLSDHNVIDLLAKLQQLGKIQVVHTLTGKQILTPRQIEREIEDHVTLNAGRISLSELQALVGVDRTYIERAVATLARQSRQHAPTSFLVVNNGEELLTNWYLDAIMEDTNTLLQESGTMSIGELAQQYGFAVEYMRDVVTSRLGSLLHAQERGNVLYTDSFVESQKAQIRGVFAAITRPTFLADLVRAHRFEERVVDEYVNELIQRRVLMGTLRGREYVPFVFIEAQRESMYSFFQQNGYLEHSRASQLQVARPFEFLKKRFPDAVALKDCVVSHALQLQVEGSIEVAVHDASVVDVSTVLPSAIHSGDVALLVSKSAFVARGSGEALQLMDKYVVSKAFLTQCHDVFKRDAGARALKAAAQQQQPSQQSTSSSSKRELVDNNDGNDNDDDDDDNSSSGKQRGKKGKKGGKAAEDAVAGKGKQRGKGGKSEAKSKGKRGKHARGGDDDDDDDATESHATTRASGKRGGASASAAISITPTRPELIELLTTSFPQTEDDEELVDALADHVETDVQQIYASALAVALSSVMRGDAASLREMRKRFEDRFDELFALLGVLEKGYYKLEMQVDAKNAAAMEQLKKAEIHLLETTGVEMASLVTSFVAASQNLEMEGVPAFEPASAPASTPATNEEGAADTDDTSGTNAAASKRMMMMTELSEDNKKILEKNLSPSTASAVVRLWTFATAGRRSLGDLTAHLPTLAQALSMPLRKMDRKKERQIVFAYRHHVIGALEDVSDEDCAATAALLMQLFFQQTTALPSSLPRQDLGVVRMVFDAFKSGIPAEAASKIEEMLQLCQRITTEGADDDDDAIVRWKELVEEVRALVVAKDLNAALSAGDGVVDVDHRV